MVDSSPPTVNLHMLLSRLKGLEEKATPKHWRSAENHKGYRNLVLQTSHLTRDVWNIAECLHDGEVDAELIIASRNSLPVLIRCLEQAVEMAKFYAFQEGPGNRAQRFLAEANRLVGELESGK